MYYREHMPLLQRMALLEVNHHNDNSQHHAGELDPNSRVTYGTIVKLQQAEGIHHEWHQRIIGL